MPLCLALALFAPSPSFARNHAIIAGGGCIDLSKGQDFFQSQVNFKEAAFKKMGWDTQRFFADETATRKVTPAGASAPIDVQTDQQFTLQHLEAALDPDAVGDDGKPLYAPGDQVLLSIDTHGMMATPGHPHEICMKDGDGIDRWVPVTQLKAALDKLAAKCDPASAKCVHITVTDGSCYGGGSIPELAGKNVCVISGAPTTHTGQGNDVSLGIVGDMIARAGLGAKFFKDHPVDPPFHPEGVKRMLSANPDVLPSDGKVSMEELFLHARDQGPYGEDHQLAQISSDVEGVGDQVAMTLPFSEVHLDPSTAKTADARNRLDRMEAAYQDARFDAQGRPCAGTALGEIGRQLEQLDAAVNAATPEARADKAYLQSELGKMCWDSPNHHCLHSLAEARDLMSSYVRETKDMWDTTADYNSLLEKGTLANGDAPPDSLAAAKARLKAKLRSVEDSHFKLRYMPLENALYLASYMNERRKHLDDDKTKACRDFTL